MAAGAGGEAVVAAGAAAVAACPGDAAASARRDFNASIDICHGRVLLRPAKRLLVVDSNVEQVPSRSSYITGSFKCLNIHAPPA